MAVFIRAEKTRRLVVKYLINHQLLETDSLLILIGHFSQFHVDTNQIRASQFPWDAQIQSQPVVGSNLSYCLDEQLSGWALYDIDCDVRLYIVVNFGYR